MKMTTNLNFSFVNIDINQFLKTRFMEELTEMLPLAQSSLEYR